MCSTAEMLPLDTVLRHLLTALCARRAVSQTRGMQSAKSRLMQPCTNLMKHPVSMHKSSAPSATYLSTLQKISPLFFFPRGCYVLGAGQQPSPSLPHMPYLSLDLLLCHSQRQAGLS